MSEIATPKELFLHELGDILYVERRARLRTLPQLIGEVSDDELSPALESHLDETRNHVRNVEQVFEQLGEQPQPEQCIGFERLRAEHAKLVEEAYPSLIDPVDLGAAARTENYEIAAYEGLRRMAKALGEDEAVELLDKNLHAGEGGASRRREDRDPRQQRERKGRRVAGERRRRGARLPRPDVPRATAPSVPRTAPTRVRLLRVCLVRGCEAQSFQELADLVIGLRFVSHRAGTVHHVAASPAHALAGDEPALDEVSDDSLCRPFGDPHHLCDVAETDVGVTSDTEKHLRVIGDEPPGLLSVLT